MRRMVKDFQCDGVILHSDRSCKPYSLGQHGLRELLARSDLDAVLIATPQHLHCEHFVAAMDAGKHVYQEKTMAFTVDHAKKMREAFRKAGKRTVQRHQMVYRALGAAVGGEIHALSLKTLTPEEWAARG